MEAKSNIHRHLESGLVLPVVSHRSPIKQTGFKCFVDPKLIRGVENRMLEYTEINPPMEIKAAGHSTLFGKAPSLVQHPLWYSTWFSTGLSTRYAKCP